MSRGESQAQSGRFCESRRGHQLPKPVAVGREPLDPRDQESHETGPRPVHWHRSPGDQLLAESGESA